jgi:hypothetical protein
MVLGPLHRHAVLVAEVQEVLRAVLAVLEWQELL